jgi:NAD(P)-dependent dehydrogenase (short-subunit alcohol dehydrogenase family)
MSMILVGAGPGLGRAIARRFAADGMPVGLIARSQERLDDEVGKLIADGHTAAAATADATDPAGLRAAIDALVAQLGAAEVLVYNAARFDKRLPSELSADALVQALQVDCVGALVAANHVAPAMREQERGTLLFTGGGYADRPWAGMASLGVGKAALRNLSRCLAQELGAVGIHVATVTIHGMVRDGSTLSPERIASLYADLHHEPSGSWRTEVDLRG